MLTEAHSPRSGLFAGAATVDITPSGSVFLFGYPHVPRNSTGVHDPLLCSALYLRDGDGAALFLANDLIFVGKDLAKAVSARLSAATGVPAEAIAISATHTHSGPITVDYLSNCLDPTVPRADPAYRQWVEERMVEAGVEAFRRAVPARAGLAVAIARGVGTNRHAPDGPADPEVPALMVQTRDGQRTIACMLAYAMHPTVLHEDSTVISSDFPHFTREFLRTRGVVSGECAILYHNGASGDQSPRHVTRGNTLAEAKRLGELLGAAVAGAVSGIRYRDSLDISAACRALALEARTMPAVETAEAQARAAKERFESLREANAERTAVRSAECDWFGADETVALAQAAEDGRLDAAVARCLPALVQVIRLGPWKFVFWPGEFFVEYALAVKNRAPGTFVIAIANGELQGYIVTDEAVKRRTYEATNALFSHENGPRVVQATLSLLADLEAGTPAVN